jgi:hypothetical protein
MPNDILSAELHSRDLASGLCACTQCSFMGSQAKDATPGGFLLKNSLPIKGSWEKALIKLPGSYNFNSVQRRNVNDFLHHIPVGVLMKGTRLLHVSNSSHWVKKTIVGANIRDNYSFFRLENAGFATAHGNEFRSRIKLQLTQDVHCFFITGYNFRYWYPRTVHSRRGSQTFIDVGQARVGGDLVELIRSAWPENYRPVAWASCHECELAFHNSIIGAVMETVAIATSEDDFSTRRIVSTGDLPTSSGGIKAGIVRPFWMGPFLYNKSRVLQAQKRFLTRNIPIELSFFE